MARSVDLFERRDLVKHLHLVRLRTAHGTAGGTAAAASDAGCAIDREQKRQRLPQRAVYSGVRNALTWYRGQRRDVDG